MADLLEFEDDAPAVLSPSTGRESPPQSRLPDVSLAERGERASVVSDPGIEAFRTPQVPRPAAAVVEPAAPAAPPPAPAAPAPTVTGPEFEPTIRDRALDFTTSAKAQAKHPVAQLESEGSQFTKGFLSGVDKTQGLLYGTVAMAGSALGRQGMVDWGLEGYQRNMAEASENAPDVESITKVGSLGELGSWAAYTMGDLIPTMASLFVGGGVGGFIGREAAKRVIKGLAEHEAKRRLARGATAGATAGAFGGSFALEGGGIFTEIMEETGQDRPGVAAAFGSAAAMMDVLPVMYVFKKLGFGKQATEAVTKKLLTDPSLKKDFKRVLGSAAKAAGGGMALESVTEGLQTVIEKAAVQYVDENKKIFTPENIDEIINSMAAGGLMGFAMGGGGGAIGGTRDVLRARQPEPELLEFEEVEAAPPPPDTLAADLEFDELAGEPLSVPEVHESSMELVEPAPAPRDDLNMDVVEMSAKEGAAAIRKAGATTNPNPTEKQIEANNYKQEVRKINGEKVAIETAKGVVRSGTDDSGRKWETKLAHPYGKQKGTVGADGEEIDIILGPKAYRVDIPVHVIDQVRPGTTNFDEHKVVMGAVNEEDALSIYHANYEKGWTGAGSVTPMTWDEYKTWSHSKPKKAVGDLGLVKAANNMEVKEVDEPRFKVKGEKPKRSPELEKFLEGSAVQDVVYHKTGADFTVFDTKISELGAHFGSQSQARTKSLVSAGQSTIPAHVSIKNPLRLRDNGGFNYYDVGSQLAELGLMSYEEYDAHEELMDDARAASTFLQNIIQKAGYDGVVYLNRREGIDDRKKAPRDFDDVSDEEFVKEFPGASDSYIAFRPEQIKSAIGNVGTYDPTNPDIRFKVKSPGKNRVSQRYPTGKKATENPVKEDLSIGIDVMAEEQISQASRLIEGYRMYRPASSANTPAKIVDRFVKLTTENLLWLHGKTTDVIRGRGSKWYDGANKIASDFAKRYDLNKNQVAGILAVLSPKMDWFINVTLAERVMDIMYTQQDTMFTEDMAATARRIFADPKHEAAMAVVSKARLGDLEKLGHKAMWLRIYDETYNTRHYRVVTPEGSFGEWQLAGTGKPRRAAWASTAFIAKAISVYENGSMSNISRQLGAQHKIRNFFNNIADPNSDRGDTTIDTHAVAAGMVMPLGLQSAPVVHNFGAKLKGEPFGPVNNSITGVQGMYPVHIEAYRAAAKQAGILSRQMQSITWETIRGIFVPSDKKAGNRADVDRIWDNYRRGRQSLAATREAIYEHANGIQTPAWARPDSGASGGSWTSSYQGELPGVRVSGRDTAELGRGARDGAAGGDSQAGVEPRFKVKSRQTDTPEFKRWFGDSKVVDENGEPLVVYHGTDAEFTVFDAGDEGAHFGTERQALSRAPEVTAYYLSIENPKRVRDVGSGWDRVIKKAKSGGFDGIVYLNRGEGITDDAGWVDEDAVANARTDAQFLAAVPHARDSWIAFYPEQIKSATDNVGTFDTTNPDIRFKVADTATTVENWDSRPFTRSGDKDVPADSVLQYDPFPPAEEAAKRYMEKAGLEWSPPGKHVMADPERGREIAYEFEIMKHDPQNKEVKAAYEAMMRETAAQYETIIETTGLTVEFIKGDDPYVNGPRDAIKDIRENNHMWVFSTRDGFGTLEDFKPEGNPLLQETPFKDANGQTMLANDLFRVVHDYFGHVRTGTTFRATGEENAWQNHAFMYTPLARRAMTVETRGQNSWLNFGPYGEQNRNAKTADTIFADQKMGLLPIWVSEENRVSAHARRRRFEEARQNDRTGLEGAIDAQGRVELVHYAHRELERNDPGQFGTGHVTRSEKNRVGAAPARTYFGIESAVQNGYRKETGLGSVRHVAYVSGELLYDVRNDPEGIWKANSGAWGDPEGALKAAGYVGYYRVHPQLGAVAAIFDPLNLELAPVESARAKVAGREKNLQEFLAGSVVQHKVYRGEHGPDNGAVNSRQTYPVFTDARGVADYYAMIPNNAGDGFRSRLGGYDLAPRTGAFYVSLRNPLDLRQNQEDVVELGTLVGRLARNGVTAPEVHRALESVTGAEWRLDGDPIDTQDTPVRDMADEAYTDTYAVFDSDAVMELVARAGYDGVAYWGSFAPGPEALVEEGLDAAGVDDSIRAAVEYRLVSRSQVKSATGNKGTFDRDNEDPLLKRATAGETAGMPVSAIERWTKALSSTWENPPIFMVAGSVDELPSGILRAIRDNGYPESDVHAVYWQGTVYLVAPNIKTGRELAEAVFHEVYGHYGAVQLFGDRYMREMNVLFNLLGGMGGIRKLAAKHNLPMEAYFENMKYQSPENRKAYIVDELLAHLQETRVNQGLGSKVRESLKRLLGILREWLASHGFIEISQYNDADIAHLLSKMERAVTSGRRHALLPGDILAASTPSGAATYGETRKVQRPEGVSEPTPDDGAGGGTISVYSRSGVLAQDQRSTLFAQAASVETGQFRHEVERVASAEDAMKVIAPLHRKAQEHMVALVLDAEGRPLQVIRHSIGMPDSASVNPGILLGAVHSVPGAASVYFAHNHPSGKPDQSAADISLTNRLTQNLAGTGVRPMGMIVVGSKGLWTYYNPIDSDTNPSFPQPSPVPEDAGFTGDHRTPVTERELTAASPYPAFSTPEDAAQLLNDREGTGVLLLNNRHTPVAWVPMTAEEMRKLREGDRASRLYQAVHAGNALKMIVKIDGREDLEAAKNIGAFAKMNSLVVLDIIVMVRGIPDSMLSRGFDVMPRGNDPFAKVEEAGAGAAEIEAARKEWAEKGTDSKYFKKWFGESKVVDESGDPLVVYHGTQADFSVFSEEFQGSTVSSGDQGFFFTNHRGEANSYAQYDWDKEDPAPNVMPVYLSIQNPRVIEIDYDSKTPGTWFDEHQEVVEEALAAGRDGLVIRSLNAQDRMADGQQLAMYVAFHPNQIKSAIGNRGTFSPDTGNILLSQRAPTFYSQMSRVLETKLPNSGTGKSYTAMVNAWAGKEFKQDELDWSGLVEWLGERGKLTKEEVMEYVRANEVRVVDVKLAGNESDREDYYDTLTEELLIQWQSEYSVHESAVHDGFIIYDPNGEVIRNWAGDVLVSHDESKARDELDIILRQSARQLSTEEKLERLGRPVDKSAAGPAKYENYVLPGGENYREVLLTLPESRLEYPHENRILAVVDKINGADSTLAIRKLPDSARTAEVAEQALRDAIYLEKRYNGSQRWEMTDLLEELRTEMSARREWYEKSYPELLAARNRNFTGGHWDQDNVLAHLRLNDRTDAQGRRVLFIEEVQSDWAQSGRKRGFSGRGEPGASVNDGGISVERDAGGLWRLRDADGNRVDARGAVGWAIEGDAIAARARLLNKPAPGVPDMPFKSTIKGNASTLSGWAGLAMKRAIRMAAEGGYDAIAWTTGEQQSERYSLNKVLDKIEVRPAGEMVLTPKDGSSKLHFKVDKEGAITTVFGTTPDQLVGRSLESVVGKEMAQKMLDSKGGTTFEGLDLKMRNRGMEGFYDDMLVNEVNKYAKKWGTKVGAADVSPQNFIVEMDDDGMWFHDGPNGVSEVTFETQEDAIQDARELYDNPGDVIGDVHALPLTDDMRDSALKGQPMFKVAGAQDSLERINETVRQRPDWKTFAKDPGKYVGGKWRDWRPATMAALTLRHLVDIGKRALPLLPSYMRVADKMFTRRGQLVVDAHEVIKDWDKLKKDESDSLATLMHNATLSGVDPAVEYKPVITPQFAQKELARLGSMARKSRNSAKYVRQMNEIRERVRIEGMRKQAHPRLLAEYKALTPAAREMYGRVKAHYEYRFNATLKALEDRLNRAEMNEKTRQAAINAMRAHFESAKLRGPYFPLARFGDFWVSVRDADGNMIEFQMFESSRQAKDYAAKARTEGYSVTEGKNIENIEELAGVSESFVKDVLEIIGTKETTSNQEAIADLKDAVYQLYLTTLPDISLRKNFIHRKKRAGFSADAKRAFAKQSFHGAYQLARLEHADILQEHMDSMRAGLKKSEDPHFASDIYTEMQKRHAWLMNPKSAKWANTATGVGFAWYLGVTPAAALVNTTQTPLVAWPLLAAEFGWGASAKQLTRAAKEYFQGGAKVKPGEWFDIEKHLSAVASKGGKRAAEELMAFRELVDLGVVDKTLAHDLIGRSETESEIYNPASHKFMGAVGWTFHHAERFNREVTAMAVYRLARNKGLDHRTAVGKAAQLTWDSHFDYQNANKARFMQGDWARVFLMFRQFSLNMTYLLARNAYNSLKGATPEERKLAKRRLSGVLGMHAIAAGALGMPLLWTVKLVLEAFFDDEDEPFDFEVEFRNWAHETLGDRAGHALTKGFGNAFLGLDISGRVSLNNLWFRDSGQDLEGEDTIRYWMEQLAGPLAAIPVSVARGYQMVQEGHTMRGIETMMPKVVKDVFKAARYAEEGVTTKRGDPIVDELSAIEILFQAQGFTPANVARQYDANRAVGYTYDRIRHRRQLLMNRFALAVFSGDDDMREDTIAEIQRFNTRNPRSGISVKQLRSSIKNRQRYSAEAIHGINLPDSYKHLTSQVTFGG